MTGGESKVSTAGTDTLLLDFMRVILAQHELHKSEEIGAQTNNVWLHLDRTASLFTALGLAPQSTEVQWMLIFKLYREMCSDVLAVYKDGTPLDQAKIPFGFHIDYKELSEEVMLDLVPYTFQKLFDKLDAQIHNEKQEAILYDCRLWQEDNKLMLAIDGDSFQVARLHDDSTIGTILTKLVTMPSGRPLHAIDIKPLDDTFDFNQLFSKNQYKWLRAMLTTLTKKSVTMQNPSKLSQHDMMALLSEINEKYRKPIMQHLSLS